MHAHKTFSRINTMQRMNIRETCFAHLESDYFSKLLHRIKMELLDAPPEEMSVAHTKSLSLIMQSQTPLSIALDKQWQKIYLQFELEAINPEIKMKELRETFFQQHDDLLKSLDDMFNRNCHSDLQVFIQTLLNYAKPLMNEEDNAYCDLENMETHMVSFANCWQDIVNYLACLDVPDNEIEFNNYLNAVSNELDDYIEFVIEKFTMLFSQKRLQRTCFDILESIYGNKDGITEYLKPKYASTRRQALLQENANHTVVLDFLRDNIDFFSAPYRNCGFDKWAANHHDVKLITLLSAGIYTCLPAMDQLENFKDNLLKFYDSPKIVWLRCIVQHRASQDLVQFLKIMIEKKLLDNLCEEWRTHEMQINAHDTFSIWSKQIIKDNEIVPSDEPVPELK